MTAKPDLTALTYYKVTQINELVNNTNIVGFKRLFRFKPGYFNASVKGTVNIAIY